MYHSIVSVPRDDTEWLVADIGGTHARIARWRRAAGFADTRHLDNAGFGGLGELLAAYRDGLGVTVKRALLALAMPVTGDELAFTNRDWLISVPDLAERLGLDVLVVVNDFVAAAAGAVSADAALVAVQSGQPQGAVRAVLGPGTGLGAAAVLEGADGMRARLIESEAGHMSFAAADAESARLLQAAQTAWGRVSWERLLSGSGLAWVDAYLRAAATPDAPAAVAQRALAGEPNALRAAQWFAHALGSFAGDVCLALRATAGIYLAGGVLAGLGTAFDHAAFCRGFTDKGRFQSLLAQVPCWHIAADDLALHGLADIARGRIDAPGAVFARS